MFQLQAGDAFVVLAILIYFVVVLTIGFIYAKRSNSSTSEYFLDRKSTRLNSSHITRSRMPSSA